MDKTDRYAEAGVNLDAANRLVDQLKPLVKTTFTPGVMTDIGSFSGLFSLNTSRYDNPVLVSAADGVGTKLKLAFLTGRHDTVGIDLVAMCINDIVVLGAKPLFFLDYLAVGQLEEEQALTIISGIAQGCRMAKTALIGGETAEMPGLYQPGEYDLAGFAVGVVDNDKIIDGSTIRVGDQLIGLASSGLHSNGFSLVRRVFFEEMGLGVDDSVEGLDCSLGEELLKPTRIYVEPVLSLTREMPISGLAHITGGGLTENIPRILPQACRVEIETGSWPVPPIFSILEEAGQISQEEMFRTFNNGLGLVLVVPAARAEEILDRLTANNEAAWPIGRVVAAEKGQPAVSYV
ncbi:MAG: phosphoribosylformylglycinamidine cyclo-ligase [Deltaproteobacteria bacterium]|nr:phosphoribosylformylglycinamidine cyclo-ligase [Deltaproteobacteria bacterium]